MGGTGASNALQMGGAQILLQMSSPYVRGRIGFTTGLVPDMCNKSKHLRAKGPIVKGCEDIDIPEAFLVWSDIGRRKELPIAVQEAVHRPQFFVAADESGHDTEKPIHVFV